MVKKTIVLISFWTFSLMAQKSEEIVKTKFTAFENYEDNQYKITFDLSFFKKLKENQFKHITYDFLKENKKENLRLSCFCYKLHIDNHSNINIKALLAQLILPSKCIESSEKKEKVISFADSFDIYGLGYYYDKKTDLNLLFIRITSNFKNEFGYIEENPIIRILTIKNNILTSTIDLADKDLNGYSYSEYLDNLHFKNFYQYVPYDDLSTPEEEEELKKLRVSTFKINENGYVVSDR